MCAAVVIPIRKCSRSCFFRHLCYARGDMTEDSDLDLRIDKGSIRGLELAGLLCDLEDALGTSVDLIPTGGLDPKFLSAIQNDEVLLYEAS